MKEIVIEEVQIYPVKPNNGLVAFASFILDRKISVNSVAIYSRLNGGYRLVYPSRTLPNSKQINVVYPIDQEIGQAIEQAVVSQFENLIKTSRKSEISHVNPVRKSSSKD